MKKGQAMRGQVVLPHMKRRRWIGNLRQMYTGLTIDHRRYWSIVRRPLPIVTFTNQIGLLEQNYPKPTTLVKFFLLPILALVISF
jgi:hypothetical protein